MTLIKTSFFTAISTIVLAVAGFVINKVIAIYVGPAGLAIIGQFQNFNSIVMTFANGAITSGVVKYTAEYREDIELKSKLFSSAIIISIVCSMIVGLFLNIFSHNLTNYILKSDDYANVFAVFGFTIILFALNTLLMSILNGQKEIKKYVIVNITSSLFSLVFASFLIIKLGLIGALYALVTNQSVIFFVTLMFVLKANWFKLECFKKGVDKESVIKLGKYSLMTLTSVLTVPVSHLIVRNYIGTHLSWDEAGYWQGIWYISTMYLTVITTSLGIYYLPRLSEIKDNDELKKEIISGYKVIMPIVSVLALGIYVFRGLVIEIAFTDKFRFMMALFKWQLIGDVIKIASWLLGYLTVAKAMTKTFITLEIVGSLSFVLLSIFFINAYGLIGVTYAFAMNYTIYLFVLVIVFRRLLR